jgi:hypothetical protein
MDNNGNKDLKKEFLSKLKHEKTLKFPILGIKYQSTETTLTST